MAGSEPGQVRLTHFSPSACGGLQVGTLPRAPCHKAPPEPSPHKPPSPAPVALFSSGCRNQRLFFTKEVSLRWQLGNVSVHGALAFYSRMHREDLSLKNRFQTPSISGTFCSVLESHTWLPSLSLHHCALNFSLPEQPTSPRSLSLLWHSQMPGPWAAQGIGQGPADFLLPGYMIRPSPGQKANLTSAPGWGLPVNGLWASKGKEGSPRTEPSCFCFFFLTRLADQGNTGNPRQDPGHSLWMGWWSVVPVRLPPFGLHFQFG